MTRSSKLTPQQKNWFNKIKQSLLSETGKTLEEWTTIARTCPESSHKARLKWLKEKHGLGNNRASVVLSAAFDSGAGWDKPDLLLNNLWKTPELRAIYDSIEKYTLSLADDVIAGPRKSFSGFSRNYQFAAARPVKGCVRLGIAVDPDKHHLEKSKSSDSWSDRVKSVIVISAPDDFNKQVKALLKSAYETS